ncbi:MAG: hypothetical protein K2P84_01150 [Undibacterium sp.]|nr:hypothetical protein [Undibacterium sp.]
MKIIREKTVCEWAEVTPTEPESGSKLGLALSTLGQQPIHGLRTEPQNGTNGWYIWCGGEMSKDEDFFSPLHIEHIDNYLPEIKEYLNLPVGFRFLIDDKNYEDVWFDQTLLDANPR